MRRLIHIKTLRIDDALNARLQEEAQSLSISEADVARIALVQYLGNASAAPVRASSKARLRAPARSGVAAQ